MKINKDGRYFIILFTLRVLKVVVLKVHPFLIAINIH